MRLFYALAGPLANLLLALALAPVFLASTGTARMFLGGFIFCSAGIGLSSAVPRKLKSGHFSEGWQAREAWRALRTPPIAALDGSSVASFMTEFDATRARWYVLWSDPRGPRRDGSLLRLLAVAPRALGFTADAREECGALFELASAGWCWRAVERGDPERLAPEIRAAAYRAAKVDPDEPGHTWRTTLELLNAQAELWHASPGTSDRERLAFQERAFRLISTKLAQVPQLTNEQRAFAFGYGIALHDVQHVQGRARTP